MTVNRDALGDGKVRRDGPWAVGESTGQVFAVSRRCRHQFGDLSAGTVDATGCLVCPWHGARYDPTSGVMVEGPRGFLGYHGPTPGYAKVVRLVARVLRLRVGTTMVKGDGTVTVTR